MNLMYRTVAERLPKYKYIYIFHFTLAGVFAKYMARNGTCCLMVLKSQIYFVAWQTTGLKSIDILCMNCVGISIIYILSLIHI